MIILILTIKIKRKILFVLKNIYIVHVVSLFRRYMLEVTIFTCSFDAHKQEQSRRDEK